MTLATEVLRVDAEATAGPWIADVRSGSAYLREERHREGECIEPKIATFSEGMVYVEDMPAAGHWEHSKQADIDCACAALYRTAAPQLARENLKLKEALEVAKKALSMFAGHGNNGAPADSALSAIARIMEDKG